MADLSILGKIFSKISPRAQEEVAENLMRTARREAAEAGLKKAEPAAAQAIEENIVQKGVSGKSAAESAEAFPPYAPAREPMTVIDEMPTVTDTSNRRMAAGTSRQAPVAGDVDDIDLIQQRLAAARKPQASVEIPLQPDAGNYNKLGPVAGGVDANLARRSADKGLTKLSDPTRVSEIPLADRPGFLDWLKNNKKTAIAGAAGTGLAINAMTGDSEENENPQPEPLSIKTDEAKEQAKKMPASEQKKTSGVKAISKEVKAPDTEEATPSRMELAAGVPTMNTVAGLSDAQNARNETVLLNQIFRALKTGGAAAIGAKAPDTAVQDMGVKSADNIVTDFKARGDQEKNDPSSAISAQFREYVKKFGVNLPENTSAKTAEDLLPSIWRSFESEENRNARAEDNKLRREDMDIRRKELQKSRQTDRDTRRTDKLRDEVNRQTKDQQTIHDQRQQLVEFLDDAMTNPQSGGFQDLAMTYGFIKGRDDSAVREGEIELLRKAGSIPDQIRRSLGRALRGQSYNKADMQSLQETLRNENEKLKKTYSKKVKPIIDVAERGGIDREDILSRPDMYVDEEPTQGSDPKIQQYADQYKLSYDAAKKILEGRGYGRQ